MLVSRYSIHPAKSSASRFAYKTTTFCMSLPKCMVNIYLHFDGLHVKNQCIVVTIPSCPIESHMVKAFFFPRSLGNYCPENLATDSQKTINDALLTFSCCAKTCQQWGAHPCVLNPSRPHHRWCQQLAESHVCLQAGPWSILPSCSCCCQQSIGSSTVTSFLVTLPSFPWPL